MTLSARVAGRMLLRRSSNLLCECVPDFSRHASSTLSPTHRPQVNYLEQAAERLGLRCFQEALPRSTAARHCEHVSNVAVAARARKAWCDMRTIFAATGRLEVQHARTAEGILPQLDEFFEQHIARRAATRSAQACFLIRRQRDYYRSIVANIGPTGWLRFTRLEWNGRAIAFHFGLNYRRRFLFGIPSFDIELQRHSPGEVLLRQLILAAMEEGATVFDFGPGEEAYKYRFATQRSAAGHVGHLSKVDH